MIRVIKLVAMRRFPVLLLIAGIAIAQQPAEQLQGNVLGIDGKPVSGAVVHLDSAAHHATTTTNDAGHFVLTIMPPGQYTLSAESNGHRSTVTSVSLPSATVTLTLKSQGDDMAFSDQPNFSVAAVTDWTAVGGHGSDAILRTSEALASATASLPPSHSPAPGQPEAPADAARRAGEQAERSGDPLTAVRDFEQAAMLDPSEPNDFAWASELLLHRAIQQAEEVFRRGVERYPSSARLHTGLGSALFAAGHYDDAAAHLCAAADLNPGDATAHLSMGRMQLVAPNPLPCIAPRLEGLISRQPNITLAHYFYAMALLKGSPNESTTTRARQELATAVALDPHCAPAYLELGVLAAADHENDKALSLFLKATTADPTLADAHYRLGAAYQRDGQPAKATLEFARHDQLLRDQASANEQQRRQLKQFLFTPQTPAASTP